jgi:hypothetical protein
LRDDDTSDEVCYAESCDCEEFYLAHEEREISDDEYYDAEGFSEEFFDWNDAESDPAPFSDSDIQDIADFF